MLQMTIDSIQKKNNETKTIINDGMLLHSFYCSSTRTKKIDYYKAKEENGREKTIKGEKREKTRERKRVSALILKRRSFFVYTVNKKQTKINFQLAHKRKKTILFIETKTCKA